MKKALIISGCIILGIILSIILLVSVLLFFSPVDEGDTDITYSVNLDGSENISNIGKEPSDEELASYYRDTIELAIKEGRNFNKEENQYMRNVNQIIKQMENDNYVLVYYMAQKDKKYASTNMCKLKIKIENGKKMYAALFSDSSELRKNAKMVGTHKEVVEDRLKAISLMRKYNFDPNKKIMWHSSGTDKIYSLKIDGQPPDEIVPYEIFGKTEYFWYYLDLKTDNAPKDMVVEMDE